MPLALALLVLAAAPTPVVKLVKSSATAHAAAVARELHAQAEPLVGCYDLALKAAPALKGTLSVTFELEPGSGVTTLSAGPGSLEDETLVPCALARLRSASWPEVKQTVTVKATYRFELRR